ncbi:MAG: hypothetical protein HY819_21680 [Acidobacteria bacterium]|nr:hypothetical protein [Acidobacteriota bacterium]
MSNNTNNEHPLIKKVEITVVNRGKGVDYNQNSKTYSDFVYNLSCPNPSHITNNNSESAGFNLKQQLDQAIKNQQTVLNFNVDCSGDETFETEELPALPCSNTIKVNVLIEYVAN